MATGSELKRLRTLSGKSADVFAKWLRVKADTYRKWETRDSDPKDADDIRGIETYFKTSLQDLKKLKQFEFYEPNFLDISNYDEILLAKTLKNEAALEVILEVLAEILPKKDGVPLSTTIAALNKAVEDKTSVISSQLR